MSLCFAFPILHGSSSPLGLQISLAHTQPRDADLFANWCEIGCGVSRSMYSKIYLLQLSQDDEWVWIQISRQNRNGFFSKQMMIQLTPLVSKSKSKKYKHPKKMKLALNSQLQTYQIWQAMIRCTFCVFLILLLLYKNCTQSQSTSLSFFKEVFDNILVICKF